MLLRSRSTAGSAFYATRSSPKTDPDRAADAIQTMGVLYLPTLVSCTPASRPSLALNQSALCAKLQTYSNAVTAWRAPVEISVCGLLRISAKTVWKRLFYGAQVK